MSDFKKGTVVELKSGGPKMTVTGYRWLPGKGEYDKETVNCKWFSDSEVKEDQFPVDTLKIVEDGE